MVDASEQDAVVQELKRASSEASELIAVLRDWCLTGMAHYHECVRLGIRLDTALNRAYALSEPESEVTDVSTPPEPRTRPPRSA
jgi:hypothetical protein